MLPIVNHALDRYLWDRSRGGKRLNAPFAYQGEVQFSAAPQDQTTIINLDTDADFVWLGLRAANFLPATALPIDPWDAAILVRYGGLGAKGFAQTAVDVRNCTAPRPVPFMLPCPKVMPAGSQFFITASIRTGAVFPAGLSVQLFGFKPFKW
jgi:hypothetical protein